MTSRTHDNFRHNFWTWVDPPPPFEQCSKKLHFFERGASLIGWSHLGSLIVKNLRQPWPMHIFVSLIFCVCLHCPLQVSGGDCWLQSHPGTLVINQPSFCLPPHSLPLHLFSMFIFIVYAQTVRLWALQTWCTRSSVAYLSSRPVVVLVVVYCLKVLSTRL